MADREQAAELESGQAVTRKAYRPPCILLRDRIEAVASTCVPPTGKTPGSCNPASINS